jgi:hypothetical protein
VNADGTPYTAPAATPDPAAQAPAELEEPASLAEARAVEQLAEQAETTVVVLPLPDRTDRKGAWVAYAASTGQITTDAADDLTRAELIARFGG